MRLEPTTLTIVRTRFAYFTNYSIGNADTHRYDSLLLFVNLRVHQVTAPPTPPFLDELSRQAVCRRVNSPPPRVFSTRFYVDMQSACYYPQPHRKK